MEAVQKRDVNSGLPRFGQAVAVSTLLAISCLISYWIVTNLLSREFFVSRDNELLGGTWAAVATIFVFRETYDQSARAALSRTLAILLSFILCLGYVLVFTFHVVGMAIVIAISITAGITTAVIFVVAGISPEHAWIQTILRLGDTAVGIVVGILASWVSVAMGLGVYFAK